MHTASGRVLVMSDADTVGLVLEDLAPGDAAGSGLSAIDAVASGHKVAVRAMSAGAPVIKYGQPIGRTTRAIRPGEHVHVHNVTAEGVASGVASGGPPPDPAPRPANFKGYVRADGRVGTRNYVGILTSVNCSANVARKIADSFPDALFDNSPEIDGVAAFTHTGGCGTAHEGEAVDNLTRVLAGYATHPNFIGVLIVGLGCEVNQIDRMLAETGLSRGPALRTLTIQEAGGTLKAIEKGREIVRELLEAARGMKRQTVSAEHLVLGLQCGGSDGWSGVTANPALGRAADRLVAAGGTAILSETPEIYGAESLLMRRAVSDPVRAKLQARLDWWADHVRRNGVELNNNPSPGNIAGGLTTILEKSLGAVAKSGSAPMQDVFAYGERITKKGFVFMDSPGYDPCSATGQMASGANLLAFTTGRGSVFGARPAPCLKLASNARMAAHMSEDMDVDCSPVLSGTSLEAMGDEIFDRLLALASGEKSQSELLGFGDLEFVPWRLGATL